MKKILKKRDQAIKKRERGKRNKDKENIREKKDVK